MAFIGSMLGAGQGSSWNATGAPLTNASTQQQADTTFNQSQSALAQQQAFLTALQGQNGINNQSQVFNQIQGVANGTGPNPAQAALNQATGNNIAATNAAMAGQRGAASNVGLIARQAGQQGAATQQNAIGQSAALQAQQQLNAINASAGIAGQQVGQQAAATAGLNQAAQGLNNSVLQGIAGQNSANAQMQGNENTSNSNIQVENTKSQQGILGGVFGGAGSILAKGGEVGVDGKIPAYAPGGPVAVQSPMIAAAVAAPQAPVAPVATPSPAPVKGPSSSFGQSIQPQANSMGSGSGGGGANALYTGLNQFSSKLASRAANAFNGPAQGGTVNNMPTSQDWYQEMTAAPGSAPTDMQTYTMYQNMPDQPAAMSDMTGGADLGGAAGSTDLGASTAAGAAGEGALADSSLGDLAALLAHGGVVPSLVSPGERYLPPSEVKKVAEGKKAPLQAGEKIPGKAKVKGDSYANDTVKKNLKTGGIVLPRHVTESPNAPEMAAKFVAAILARQGIRGK